jgi:hypothetical protein
MMLQVFGAVPLPVGRRVSVRWYKKTTPGVFSPNVEERPTQPAIEDLETGVVYSFEWMYDVKWGEPDEPPTYSEPLEKGIEETRSIVGRITSCRVLTSSNTGHLRGTYTTHTELVITEEPAGEGAYR